jgi:antitoxin VapB
MALQIANSGVVAKVERLAKATGMTKTAVVEHAVDLMARESGGSPDFARRLDAILVQADRVPKADAATDPLPWDAHGLPV